MNRKTDAAALALIVLTMLRIASTWTIFSATVDEPMHISAGLELYTQHKYTYQPENPPLPRLVHALLPWIGGVDFDPGAPIHVQLQRVFVSDGRYTTNLVLARTGNLLFFLLACLTVWLWARRELGSGGGLAATFLFTMQPMIVGHAGVATHDMAATAATALSLFAFSRWMDDPSVRRATAFGAAFGLAVLCKFSCIGYVPAACAAMYVVRLARDRRTRAAWKALLPSLAAASTVTLLVIWSGYAFTTEKFILGIRGLAAINEAGHFSYFMGEVGTKGWLAYFPVAIGLKTTVASLLLALGAMFVRGHRVAAEALVAALAILAVAMPSNLDLGARYVLPLYAPLNIAAAATVLACMQSRKWIAVTLLLWHGAASVITHPDAIPYFNELAGRQPWHILADSNIDWGQDVLRLQRVTREKKIDRIGLALLGWHDFDALGFPPYSEAFPTLPTQGWVAVSETLFQLKRFEWLRGRRYERVGKSIRLYYIP